MHKRFVVGIDRSRMKLFDVSDSQQNLVQDVPVFDNSTAQEKFSNFKNGVSDERTIMAFSILCICYMCFACVDGR